MHLLSTEGPYFRQEITAWHVSVYPIVAMIFVNHPFEANTKHSIQLLLEKKSEQSKSQDNDRTIHLVHFTHPVIGKRQNNFAEQVLMQMNC